MGFAAACTGKTSIVTWLEGNVSPGHLPSTSHGKLNQTEQGSSAVGEAAVPVCTQSQSFPDDMRGTLPVELLPRASMCCWMAICPSLRNRQQKLLYRWRNGQSKLQTKICVTRKRSEIA